MFQVGSILSSPEWNQSVREPRTRATRSSSWRRSSTSTDTWLGGDASRLPTRFVCQNGKSKSGSRTDGWSTKRTTSCPTRRTSDARRTRPESRPSSVRKRGSRGRSRATRRRRRWPPTRRPREGAERRDPWAGLLLLSTTWTLLTTNNSSSSSTTTAAAVSTVNTISTTRFLRT